MKNKECRRKKETRQPSPRDRWRLFSLVLVSFEDPHGLSAAYFAETVLLVEVGCSSVSDDDLLVEILVRRGQAAHQLTADSSALVVRVDQQVRVVDDKVAVGDGVAEADEAIVVPRRNEGVGVAKGLLELLGFVRRRPAVARVEVDKLVEGEIACFLESNSAQEASLAKNAKKTGDAIALAETKVAGSSGRIPNSKLVGALTGFRPRRSEMPSLSAIRACQALRPLSERPLQTAPDVLERVSSAGVHAEALKPSWRHVCGRLERTASERMVFAIPRSSTVPPHRIPQVIVSDLMDSRIDSLPVRVSVVRAHHRER